MRGIADAGAGHTVPNFDVIHCGFDDDASRAITQLLEIIEAVANLLVRRHQAFAVVVVEHLANQIRPGAGLLQHRGLGGFHRRPFRPGTDQREYVADEHAARAKFRRGHFVDGNLAGFLVLDYLKQLTNPFKLLSECVFQQFDGSLVLKKRAEPDLVRQQSPDLVGIVFKPAFVARNQAGDVARIVQPSIAQRLLGKQVADHGASGPRTQERNGEAKGAFGR